MLSCTLKDYKTNYKIRLLTYLEEYEDNTDASFLSLEFEKYTDYYNSLVKSDSIKSNNAITSVNRILEFIGKQLTISRSPNRNAAALYLTGELPQGTTKQQSVIPREEIVVNTEDSVKPEKPKIAEQSELINHTKSIIEDCLVDIVNDINSKDYIILVDALYSYFTTGNFPKLENQIRFNPVNKKKVGWALKIAYKTVKMDTLNIEYFRFAKENINLFSKEVIVSTDFNKSKFYKLFTTKPTN